VAWFDAPPSPLRWSTEIAFSVVPHAMSIICHIIQARAAIPARDLPQVHTGIPTCSTLHIALHAGTGFAVLFMGTEH
jgi:hypothetical protein